MPEQRQPHELEVVPSWLVRAAGYGWRLLVLAGVLYVTGTVLGRFQVILLPVFAALLLSSVLVPPAQWLRCRGFPALLATWIVFLGVIGVTAGVVALLIPSVSGDFTRLGHELSQGGQRIERWLQNGPLHVSRSQVDTFVASIRSQLTKSSGTIAHYGLTGASVVLETAAGLLLTLVLTFYFVKDGGEITAWLTKVMPDRWSAPAAGVGRATWATISGYVRGTAVNGLVDASLMASGLYLLRVPLVVPIALLTLMGGFLPLVGAVASGAIAALVALVAKGPVAALIVVGMTVVIHNVEGYLVGPLVLGRAVHLHPTVILLSIAAGTVTAGAVGAFLAVPVVGIAVAVASALRSKGSLNASDRPAQQAGAPGGGVLGPLPTVSADPAPAGPLAASRAGDSRLAPRLGRAKRQAPPWPVGKSRRGNSGDGRGASGSVH
ncbi:MAG TPA: AI-2E family transporter [Acidimicrobiales bacterium]|nr:AI-2E family transporter [Acidimicrobiales bacterium]